MAISKRAPYEHALHKDPLIWEIWHMYFAKLDNQLNSLGSTGETVRITDADSPYTISVESINLVCDTDGGAIMVNYPPGANNAQVRVVNAGSSGNNVTVNGNGSEKIRGSASQTLFDDEILDSKYETTEGWR